MLGETFTYSHVGSQHDHNITTELYSFKCGFNQYYIVEIEHHKSDIHIIKFFQKNHRDSKYRYCLVNKPSIRKGSTGAKNFLMILNTVTKIIFKIVKYNTNASFGFMGAPTKKELNPKKSTKTINEDGTVVNTKRFNTYSIYISRYFDPEIFKHVKLNTSSCYLIKKKSNTTLTTPNIEKFFANYISDYC